ncbi:hypothetical protein RDWZM_006068 [Blomia tropicalis]|uniref:Uncharacterized protein n=1 Tax=Blomia tropicalis TaxID=40697 RepID=A0A9Q0RP05_BLOTA|nr:hypothetical protein BLOT_009273 [Blomia tropicalis]KAJ6220256.1 hypothetical protein RDWZM_006068 [Blomia tropicalis]
MKFFIVLVASALVVGTLANPTTDDKTKEEQQKLDMKEIEKLLQQIESADLKPKPDEDPTVSASLQKLFSTFRQMTKDYVNFLNTINKSIGLPKYPTLPGLGARQSDERSGPLRQIQENLSQLQSSAVEVGQLVRRVVVNVGSDSRNTIMNQFRRFTDLWSKQLNEISNMIQDATNPNLRQEQTNTIFDQINKYLQQVNDSIRDFANSIYHGIRNRLPGTGGSQTEA